MSSGDIQTKEHGNLLCRSRESTFTFVGISSLSSKPRPPSSPGSLLPILSLVNTQWELTKWMLQERPNTHGWPVYRRNLHTLVCSPKRLGSLWQRPWWAKMAQTASMWECGPQLRSPLDQAELPLSAGPGASIIKCQRSLGLWPQSSEEPWAKPIDRTLEF